MSFTYWKSLLWTGIIAFILFTPGDKLPDYKILSFNHFDKIVHFGLFLILQFLVCFENRLLQRPAKLKTYMIIALIVTGFAISTEIAQKIIIYERDGNLYDLIADVTGIILAYPAYILYYRIKDLFFPANP